MHKQTKKLRKLMHNNKSSEEAMVPLSLENFKLKSKQTTTFKNSENLRADLHGERERERERELQMLLYPFPKQSSALKDHGMREGRELQMILYPFPKQISALQEHSSREI
jgi:hypothetical protein